MLASQTNALCREHSSSGGGGGGGIEYSHTWIRFAIVVEKVIVSEVFSPKMGYHLLSLFILIKTGYLPKMCLLTLQCKNGLVIGKQVLHLMLLNFHCHKSDIKLTCHAFCFLLEQVEYHQLF